MYHDPRIKEMAKLGFGNDPLFGKAHEDKFGSMKAKRIFYGLWKDEEDGEDTA